MAQATAQLTAAAAQRRTARRDGNGKEPSSAVLTSTGYVYDPEKPSTWIPNESPCTIFEWPLTGLKEIFDTSKQETKSKVLKSVPFGGGRWSILFYAQSGHDQVRGREAEPERARCCWKAHFASPPCPR